MTKEELEVRLKELGEEYKRAYEMSLLLKGAMAECKRLLELLDS